MRVRARIAAVSAADAWRARSPADSAARSRRRTSSSIPASSPTRSLAGTKGSWEPARAGIWPGPGDSDTPATPSSWSRGASPVSHRAQW
jgi:hypothetical protein